MSQYFNIIWIFGSLVFLIISTGFWIFLAWLCYKITGKRGQEYPCGYELFCLISGIITFVMTIISAVAPYNNWYNK